jgi:hypothetical protein
MSGERSARSRPDDGVSSYDKIARLLGLLAIKELKQQSEKIALLRAAGFEPSEVSTMLGISNNQVSVVMYKARRTNGKPPRKKRHG